MSQADDEQQIRDVIATWMEASATGDTARVLDLMTEDVVFLRPGYAPMRGRQAFADASRSMSPKVQFQGDSQVQEVRVDGEHAYCWTQLGVTVRDGEGAILKQMSGHTLSVFHRQPDGRWLLARDANMLAPVASEAACA